MKTLFQYPEGSEWIDRDPLYGEEKKITLLLALLVFLNACF